MITDVKGWQEWEDQGPLSEPADFHRNLRLVESMYEFARKLGVFPPEDPLEGFETDLRVARIVNGRGSDTADR